MSSNLSVSGQSTSLYYGKLASGKKVQTASDGAAQLAIIQKMIEEEQSYSAASRNISAAQSLSNISDGALSGINDYLQDIYALGIQASNSLMSSSDLASIQTEIDSLKQGITGIASNVNYNGMNLLDGSSQSLSVATGSGSISLSSSNATLEALGIADFSVTGDFDLGQIEDALAAVSAARSTVGAQSNGLEYAYRSNAIASYNTTSAHSRLEDLDYPQAISEQKKNELLQEYAFYMQAKNMQNAL